MEGGVGFVFLGIKVGEFYVRDRVGYIRISY